MKRVGYIVTSHSFFYLEYKIITKNGINNMLNKLFGNLPKPWKTLAIILFLVAFLIVSIHVTHWIACHFIDVSEGY